MVLLYCNYIHCLLYTYEGDLVIVSSNIVLYIIFIVKGGYHLNFLGVCYIISMTRHTCGGWQDPMFIAPGAVGVSQGGGSPLLSGGLQGGGSPPTWCLAQRMRYFFSYIYVEPRMGGRPKDCWRTYQQFCARILHMVLCMMVFCLMYFVDLVKGTMVML